MVTDMSPLPALLHGRPWLHHEIQMDTLIPPDKIRWCWLELGGASVMLQEYNPGRIPTEELGKGASIWFQCQDSLALYYEFKARGIETRETLRRQPHVGRRPSPTPTATASTSNPPRMSPKETKLSESTGWWSIEFSFFPYPHGKSTSFAHFPRLDANVPSGCRTLRI